MNEDDYPDEWDITEPSEYETDQQYKSTDCKPYQ